MGQKWWDKVWSSTAEGAASGAIAGGTTGAWAGATGGSAVLPVVGTVAGAGALGAAGATIGGIGGGLMGLVHGISAGNDAEAADEAQAKQSAIAEQNAADMQAGRAQRDSLLRQIGAQANPYADNNPGVINEMALQQGAIDRNFVSATEDARRSLAMRGGLGTAQEQSLLRRIGVDRALAKSGAEAKLRADNYNNAQAFEQSRKAGQLGLIGSLRSNDAAGIYGQQADQHREQVAQGDRNFGQTIGSLAQIGALYNDPNKKKPAETGTKQAYGYWGLG